MARRGSSGGFLGALIVPLLVFSWLLSKCSCGDDMRTQQARLAAEEQRTLDLARARDQAADDARAEVKRNAQIKADRERGWSPVERAAAIGAALPDVCEAKRILGLTADVDAPELKKTRAAIAAAEKKQLRAERPAFDQGRGLVCNDGSESPSCSCPGHQGCCSHHGGVHGCDPYPTEVSCPYQGGQQ